MFKDSQPTHTELIRRVVDGTARWRLVLAQLNIQDHIPLGLLMQQSTLLILFPFHDDCIFWTTFSLLDPNIQHDQAHWCKSSLCRCFCKTAFLGIQSRTRRDLRDLVLFCLFSFVFFPLSRVNNTQHAATCWYCAATFYQPPGGGSTAMEGRICPRCEAPWLQAAGFCIRLEVSRGFVRLMVFFTNVYRSMILYDDIDCSRSMMTSGIYRDGTR